MSENDFDIQEIKKDFPIFTKKVNGKDLVYLDSAATSQKPRQVIDALSDFYSYHNANVHRGIHTLGDEATNMYDLSRKRVAAFIGARVPEEIIFTKNSTNSLNMVAWGWGIKNLKEQDTILILISEHNSNLLPWQMVSKRTGATLEYVYENEFGELPISLIKEKLTKNVKIIVLSHASNVLGTIFDVKEISSLAKENGTVVVVDGAQAVSQMPVNVQSLGCDFYAFSSHKMLGPMGIGVLWGRSELLSEMVPMELGGGTVIDVDLNSFRLTGVPERFEAGTPDVAGAVGLAAAVEYLQNIGMDTIRSHEISINKYALDELSKIDGLKILGPTDPLKRTGLISFYFEDMHSHDIASILNSEGVAVRSGMHCAMTLHKSLHIPASTRASWYIYNSNADIDSLVVGIKKAIKILR